MSDKKWTTYDVEDAQLIKGVYKLASRVRRVGISVELEDRKGCLIKILNNRWLFPSLKNGEQVSIDEVLNYKEVAE